MAFISVSSFVPRHAHSRAQFLLTHPATCRPSGGGQWRTSKRSAVSMTGAPIGGNGKKQSRSRRNRPGKSSALEKKKLEAEVVFMETPPSRYELIVPTLSILTVIGLIPFVGAVARAAWVRYKITSRRISIKSGFQGKDQTEIIYRDIEKLKYIRRLGDAADCVITLKDGAKLEIRAIPQFNKVFEYVMERVDEKTREQSGPA